MSAPLIDRPPPATMALEVIWPRHRWHYLTVADPDTPTNPPPLPSTWADAKHTPFEMSEGTSFEMKHAGRRKPDISKRRRLHRARPRNGSPAAVDPTHQQGRALAVHAFLQGAECPVRRVGALLEVSTRTVGRDRGRPPLTAAPILERAQALIAGSADRGSTAEERGAAEAWLATGADAIAAEAGSSPAMEVCMSPERQAAPTQVRLTLDQVDALTRQQQRIAHRSALIHYVLAAEQRCGQTLPMGDALAELLTDITDAARTIATIVQATHPAR